VRGLTARLRAAGCVAAEEEARLLREGTNTGVALQRAVRRRVQGEPLAWILGWTAFAGQRIVVAPGVYVPRPQSEALARRAAVALPPGGRLVDLCTGSGAIAAWVARTRPDAVVTGVDVDATAVACAAANGVRVVRADVSRVSLRPASVDVVTAVAPYVPHDALDLLPLDVRRYEPALALDGGVQGLEVVREVVRAAGILLRPGGVLLVEVGGDQDVLLRDALAGFNEIETWRDEEGDLRGLVVEVDGGGERRIAGDLDD
jgi:release factor glutamine methyltransferase